MKDYVLPACDKKFSSFRYFVDNFNGKVLVEPNPILHTLCSYFPVEWIGTKPYNDLINKMYGVKLDYNAVGLAANQIGIPYNIFIANTNSEYSSRVWVNPKLSYFSDEKEMAEEGCLSLPNVFVNVIRPSWIVVRDHFRCDEVKLVGKEARIWQHEYQHLLGLTILDRQDKNDMVQSNKVWCDPCVSLS